MVAVRRGVLVVVAGVAVGLAGGGPAVARVSAGGGVPGWRVVREFSGCGNGQVLAVTARAPGDAWASGYEPLCPGGVTAPLLAHWNGRSWGQVSLPSRFTTGGSNGATDVAALSGSYAWTFAGIGSASDALLQDHGRWHVYGLAANAYVSSSVVFGRGNAWAFGSIGASAYAARFNGRAWRRVGVPVVPQSTADPGPSNIWAVGPVASPAGSQRFGLAHWTGRWATVRLPGRLLPAGARVDYAWVVSDGGRGAFVAAGISARPGWVLLLWTGSTWVKVATPAAADVIGPIARDGHGGLWVASVPPGTCPAAGCDTVTMLHRHGAGTWSRTVVKVANLGLTDVRLIPGTTSLWASGNIITGSTGDFVPVILKYGL